MGVMITRIVKFIHKGEKGDAGRSVVSVDVEYAKHTSNTTAPTYGWQTDAPAYERGYYIWTRTHIVYSEGADDYTDPICITGREVLNIVEEYYKSTSATVLQGGSWSTTRPTWSNNTYIWVRSHIYLTDTSYYTTAICVTGAKGNDGTPGAPGLPGMSIFNSIVFCRTPIGYRPPQIDQSDGSYLSPVPENIYQFETNEGVSAGISGSFTWSDSVPYDNGAKPLIWMAKCVFTSTGASTGVIHENGNWSDPALLADTADFDVEYNTGETAPSIPEHHPLTTADRNTYGWSNTANENTVWMAVSYRKAGGVWTAWAVSRIKGENGDDGTSVTVKGKAREYFNNIFVVQGTLSTHTAGLPSLTPPSSNVPIAEIERQANQRVVLIDDMTSACITRIGYIAVERNPNYNSVTGSGNEYWYAWRYADATEGDTYTLNGHLWCAAPQKGWIDLGDFHGPEGPQGAKGDKGNPGAPGPAGARGPVLRGPQAWSDCADGYAFQSGAADDDWKDVVMYNEYYYSCVKSHTKSSGNYPGSAADINNHYWQATSPIELIAARIILAEYELIKNLGVEHIDMRDANGNILFQASDGNVICKTGTFENVTVNGTINATAGNIAGFKIKGNGLTNEPFTNDAYIIFRNDARKCFAGIGGNILPISSGLRAVARFENEDTTDQWGLGRNIAMLLSAKGGAYNHAFCGEGNGNLNGWIDGYKFSKLQLEQANTIYDRYTPISENNRWVVYSTVSGAGINLPRLSNVRVALGISNSTPFCIRFMVVADYGSNSFSIFGRNNKQSSSNTYLWNTTELPLLLHWDNGRWDDMTMGAGDTVEFLLVYDPTKSETNNNWPTTYTARIINLQS